MVSDPQVAEQNGKLCITRRSIISTDSGSRRESAKIEVLRRKKYGWSVGAGERIGASDRHLQNSSKSILVVRWHVMPGISTHTAEGC